MGKGQSGLKAALGFAIALGGSAVVGIQPAVAATSPGCAAANAGTFDLSIPIGNPAQFGGSVSQTFAAGDVITATTTGTPTGTQAFLSQGGTFVSIVNASFADVTGSGTVPTAGTFTLTRTLSANVLNGGTLTFTCVPGPMVSGGSSTGADGQADTATNATTTAVIVEDRVVDGILDDVITTNPSPPSPPLLTVPERIALDAERGRLIDQQDELTKEGNELSSEIPEMERAIAAAEERIDKEEDPDTRDALSDWGALTLFIEKLVPININEANIYNDERIIERLKEGIKAATERLAEIDQQQSENRARIDSINALLGDKPTIDAGTIDDNYNPDLELDDLGGGDGESILFAGRDPFARALMRYRGFRLDVADTGEGFSDSVKPLSFTKTLSSTMVGWVRAVYTDYEQDDASQQEGDNILLALGIHKDINDELRVGLFATTTWGDVTSPVNNLDIDTNGYSLGAYGRYKWGEIDVNASTRIGLTDNDISVSGTTGSYDTRLASATLGISGQEQLADDVWMRPAISVTGTWVNREDYVNSAGTPIGGNTTWSGNVTAGPTIGTSLTPPEGLRRLEPAIGLQATYTFSDQDTQSGSVTTSEDDYLSLSVSPQLSLEFDNGASLDVFGSYFGIGADLDGWSVGGTVSIPLN